MEENTNYISSINSFIIRHQILSSILSMALTAPFLSITTISFSEDALSKSLSGSLELSSTQELIARLCSTATKQDRKNQDFSSKWELSSFMYLGYR